MSNLNQKGVVNVLFLIAAVGLVGFLLISSSASFKDDLFAQLFPKKLGFASEPLSCGAFYVCTNNGNSCMTSSGGSCTIGDPCDCSGSGTITQCVDSGVDCGTRYGLSGSIFFDTNRNGIYDSATGETIYNKASTTLLLTKPDGSTVSAGVQSSYSFSLLTQTGTYTLTLTAPQGYQVTTPNPVNVTITPSGASSPNIGLVDLTEGPELYSSQLTCPSFQNGRFANWTATITNGGLKPANVQGAVNELSIQNPSKTTIAKQQFPIGTVNPDQSISHTLDLSKIRTFQQNAAYTFILRIDRYSNVAEANEQNNYVSITCWARN